jgi:hypothetical protein
MPMTRGPDHVIAIGFLKAHAIPVALSMVEHGSDPSSQKKTRGAQVLDVDLYIPSGHQAWCAAKSTI